MPLASPPPNALTPPGPYLFLHRMPAFRLAAGRVGVQPAAQLRHVQGHGHELDVLCALRACLGPHSLESGPPRACRLCRRHPQRPHASRPAPLPTSHARLSTRQGAEAFNQPLSFSSFDTSKVTTMVQMFDVRSARALPPTALVGPSPSMPLASPPPSALTPPGPHLFLHRMPAFRLGRARRRLTSRSASTRPRSRL